MIKKVTGKVVWEPADDISARILALIDTLNLPWIKSSRIYSFRSHNSSTRAYARIWGLSRIFQLALDIEPAYVIEVISEKFDKLSAREQDKVLVHELVHIPKTFSGSLAPHTRRSGGKKGFEDRVRELVHQHQLKSDGIY